MNNKFVAVVFPDEGTAYKGIQALEELHREGSVTVFGTVTLQKAADGTVSIKQQSDEGPIGLGVGALAGSLIGLLAGPAGAAVGLAAGSLAGGWRDVFHAVVSDEFVEQIQRELTPGRFAIVAEVSEDWLAPIDTRMEALGGIVMREWRDEFVDELAEREAAAAEAELAQWKAERAAATEQAKAKVNDKIARTEEKLRSVSRKIQERMDQQQAATEAKLDALEQQAKKAKGDAKQRIEQRMSEVKQSFEERKEKLRRAHQHTEQASA